MIFLTHCVLCGLSGKKVQKLKAIIKEAGLTWMNFWNYNCQEVVFEKTRLSLFASFVFASLRLEGYP